MKRLETLLLLVILPFIAIQAQIYSTDYGKIGREEFELEYYSKDKDAEALVFFDKGKSWFVDAEGSFEVIFERKTRIKILSEAGIKWAEIEIPYYQEGDVYEKVHSLEAFAYNYEDGQIKKTALNLSNSYTETINDYWKVEKFAVPNVKPGTVIEYKYKINSQYLFNLRDWEFQWRIPVLYSEYEANMIPFYDYTYILQQANKFDAQQSYVNKMKPPRRLSTVEYLDMVHKYIMTDIPAFKDEEYITSVNDHIIKLDFQLSKISYPSGVTMDIMTTWEDMIEKLLKHEDFGKYIKKSGKLGSKILDEKILSEKTEQEKFDYIVDYVKSNLNWDGMKGKYASKKPKKLIDEKHGNCADINLMILGMLKNCGIEAYPVLISTRQNGKIKYDYPFAHFFNYVIVMAKIDGQNILTDGTGKHILNSRIPVRCINDKGLIINEEAVQWVRLECLNPSELSTQLTLSFEEQQLRASMTKITTEYEAYKCRSKWYDDTEKIKEELDSKEYIINASSIKVRNASQKSKPYILSYELSTSPEIVNEKIYLHPFLNEVIRDNPLKQRSRTYPIDMTYPKKRIYRSIISIPEGYRVEYLPEEQRISNSSFEMTYTIKESEGKIDVSFEYFFKESVYPSKDYLKLKVYFDELINKGNEKIVLVKNENANT